MEFRSFKRGTAGLSRPKGCKIASLQSLRRPGIEPGSLEDQIYNNEFAKNVASNPKGLEIFLTANFEGP